jgi:hypothetical protein
VQSLPSAGARRQVSFVLAEHTRVPLGISRCCAIAPAVKNATRVALQRRHRRSGHPMPPRLDSQVSKRQVASSSGTATTAVCRRTACFMPPEMVQSPQGVQECLYPNLRGSFVPGPDDARLAVTLR